MKEGEIRLPGGSPRDACAAFHAGICPVLTGMAVTSECGCHHACVIKGMTALVADDDDNVLHLNMRVLQRMGVNVVACPDGQNAYTTVTSNQHQFDLAVLDITMPGCDGFEVCRAIRSQEASVPVVFATAYDGYDLHRKLDEVEANALITKPFTLKQIRLVAGGMLCSFMGQYLFGNS